MMSRLKIFDLSFCETEISKDLQVQGGSAGHPFHGGIPDFLLEDLALLDRAPDDFSLEKEVVDPVGNKYRISAKKTKDGRAIAIAGGGHYGDVKYAVSSASATSKS